MSESIRDLLEREGAASEEGEAMVGEHAPLPEGTEVSRGHSRTKTLQIRLNGDEFEELEMLAKARDLPVSTVARALLLTSLAPSDDVSATLARLEQNLAALRNRLAQL